MRLDADDILEPGALAALATALSSAPDAAVAWGDVQTFGLTTFRVPTAPSLDPWLFTYTNCVPGTGCLTRRSAVVEAGGWQVRDGWEDWDLWLALAERGWKGVYVPRVTVRYRRDEGGRFMESGGHGGCALRGASATPREALCNARREPKTLGCAASCQARGARDRGVATSISPRTYPTLRARHPSLLERWPEGHRDNAQTGGCVAPRGTQASYDRLTRARTPPPRSRLRLSAEHLCRRHPMADDEEVPRAIGTRGDRAHDRCVWPAAAPMTRST